MFPKGYLLILGLTIAIICNLSCISRNMSYQDGQSGTASLPEEMTQKNFQLSNDGIDMGPVKVLSEDLPDNFTDKSMPWTPLLLPTRSNAPLVEKDFLASKDENLDGKCVFWKKGNKSKENYINISSLAKDPHTLFYILEKPSYNVVGIGALNAQGNAVCELIPGIHVLSSGTGKLRRETEIPLSLPLEGIALPSKASGIVEFEIGDYLHTGDIIRVGRYPASVSTLNRESNRIARMIESDLFVPVVSHSENHGLEEYLYTSILVGETGFSLALEEGRYRISVIRSEKSSVCTVEMSLTKTSKESLKCIDKFMHQKSEDYKGKYEYYDATVFPKSLNILQYFSNFLKARFAKVAPEMEYTENDGYSNALAKKGNNRVFGADSLIYPEEFCKTARSYVKSGGTWFAGTGEWQLLHGATPFLTKTTKNWFKKQNGAIWFLSNGANVNFSNVNSETGMLIPFQNTITATITAPEDYLFNNAIVFVNNEEIKRYFMKVNKDSFEDRSFEISTKSQLNTDFLYTVCAWGDDFLPEYLTGFRGVKPILLTRPICVDADEDGICSVNQKQE